MRSTPPADPSARAPSNVSRDRWSLAALTALLGAAYLPQLGTLSGPTRPEEQFNMAVSSEMHRLGAWATPTLDGSPWFYKPPLLYWLERVAYALSGPSAFTARLPAALAAIALALVTGGLARRMGASRALATLLCGGSLGLFMNGRLAITDSLLSLALALAFSFLWEAHRRVDGRWVVASGAAAGLGVLAKGPVAGVIFVVAALAFALLRTGRPRPDPLLRPGTLALATLVAILVAAPWYALMLARHREAFFDFFFVQMNVDRFRTPWRVESLAVLWGGLLLALVPWLPLAVSGVIDGLSPQRRRDPRVLLALCWASGVMLTFSVPAQKFVHYSLPAVPAFALLAALSSAERGDSKASRWGAQGTALVLLVGSLAGVVAMRILPPLPALSVAVAAGLAAVAFFRGRLTAASGFALGAIAVALAWLTPAAGFAPWPHTPVPDRPLATFREAPGLVAFSSGRVVRYLKSPEERDAALASGTLVWMAERDFPGAPYAIVASAPSMRTDVAPEDVWQAFKEGGLRPLVGRMVIVGKPE
jgi:4-amino-4-deoxy-L-arabinose transferase-like glycosyltransferase